MNASELRIGNFIQYNGKVYQIDSIAEALPTLNTSEFGIGVVDWNNINPIPLTEEWLIRLGFEEAYKSSMHSTYWNKKLSYYFWYESGNKHAEFFGVQINCIYLHQLQNLYFALTGEELSVK